MFFQLFHGVFGFLHNIPESVRIHVILLPHFGKVLIIPKNGLLQKVHDRCETFCHIGDRAIYLSDNFVNIGNSFQCLRSKISNLGSNHCKSLSGFPCSCRLNIGIQCQQICLGRNLFNVIGQGIDSFNCFCLFHRRLTFLFHDIIHFICLIAGLGTDPFHFSGSFLDLAGVFCSICRQTVNISGALFHDPNTFHNTCRVGSGLLHTCCKLLGNC